MAQQFTSLATICESPEKGPEIITFEQAMTEAVDEVFQSLGENVKQSIYRCLENNYKIRKLQIPLIVESFTGALESIFGDASKLVELKIMKKLQAKVDGFTYKPKSNEVLFVEYLNDLKEYSDLQRKLLKI